MGLTPLKEAFPRVFALAVVKEGLVQDFGHWSGSNWVWSVTLRRQLFDWEKFQWNSFVSFLGSIPMRRSFKDMIDWKFCSKCVFLVSSFRKVMEDFESQNQLHIRFI